METEDPNLRAEFLKTAFDRFESLEFAVLSSVPGIHSLSDFIRSKKISLNIFLTHFFKNIQIAKMFLSNKVSSFKISAARSVEQIGFLQISAFADQNCARFTGLFFRFLCAPFSTSTRRAIFSAVLKRDQNLKKSLLISKNIKIDKKNSKKTIF